jgi:hypothetical protein
MIFSSFFFCKITVQPLLKSNCFLGKNKACSVSDYYTLFAERQVRLKSRVGRNWKLKFLMVCSLVNASVISILLAILNLFWVRLYSAAGCPCIFFFHLSEILSIIQTICLWELNLCRQVTTCYLFILVCDIDLGLGHFSSFTNFFKSMGSFCTSIEWK